MTALRILHVDDEPDIREVVEVSLGLDPEIVTRSCASGAEALVVAVDWPPDIILLDVMMPGMDGPTTLTHLRNNSKTSRIPVVFMTARAQASELDQFRALGAAGVVPKPFDPMTLAATVSGYAPQSDPRLEALRKSFLQRLCNDAAALAWDRSALQERLDTPAALTRIREIAHGLSGAGGVYGFSDISDAAAALEEAVVVKHVGIDRIVSALDALLACVEANTEPQSESRSEPQGIRIEA